MVDYINPQIWNIGLALATAFTGYAINSYFPRKKEVTAVKTKQVSKKAFSISSRYSQELTRSFRSFKEQVEQNADTGRKINPDKLLENIILEGEGMLPDLQGLFMDPENKKAKFNIGVLFNSSVAIRKKQRYLTTEVIMQSLFDCLDPMRFFKIAIGSYDSKLRVIRDFQNTYNSTNTGVMPKATGYYSEVGFAIEQFGSLFPTNRTNNVMYLITPEMSDQKQEEAQRQITNLKQKNISVGVIYVTDRQMDISELKTSQHLIGANQITCVNYAGLDEFPKQLTQLNKKIAEEGTWKYL